MPASSHGRSQALTTTSAGAAQRQGVEDRRRPARRRVAVRTSAQSQRRERLDVTALADDRVASATGEGIGDPLGQRDAVDLEQRLVGTHAAAAAAGEHDAGRCHRRLVGRAGRVELEQELAAALGLVGLPDLGRHQHRARAAHRRKPWLPGARPAHVAGATPAVGAQGVEAAVVADPVGGVALDHVAPVVAERRPALQQARVVGDDLGDRRPSDRWTRSPAPAPRAHAGRLLGMTVDGSPDDIWIGRWSD